MPSAMLGAHRLLLALLLAACTVPTQAQDAYDIVIANGRVMDPETGFDEIRNVGIRGPSVVSISRDHLAGEIEIDATGLVVAPGFIDLHAHGQSARANEYQAMDGVTTALELESGVLDMPAFLARRSGDAVINFGASVSHGALRAWSMPEHRADIDAAAARVRQSGDEDDIDALGKLISEARYKALDTGQYPELRERLEEGLRDGGLGVGMPHQYYPGVSEDEIFRVFQFAAERGVPIYTHVREMGVTGVQEVVANAIATGAPLHIVHLNSSSLWDYRTNLDLIYGAIQRGADITTEAYPYTAGSTGIGSAIFDEGWQERLRISYGDVQWQDTGERLNEQTFNEYREQGGTVIIHMMKPEWIRNQLREPWVMVASDGMPYAPGAHPRSAGTFSRFLGRYVRDQELMSLMAGLAKVSLMPARRLESVAPQMKRKGRIQLGSDADITVFSAERIIDNADFRGGLKYSTGVQYVLVNGEFVVWDGELVDGARPGQAILGRYSVQ